MRGSETIEELWERGYYFLWWLGQRPERNLAVVSHCQFLSVLFEHGKATDSSFAS